MDKIFKIGLLVLGFGYLTYLFCPITNQVGRYRYHVVEGKSSIVDTANADIYLLLGKGKNLGWSRINPTQGPDFKNSIE